MQMDDLHPVPVADEPRGGELRPVREPRAQIRHPAVEQIAVRIPAERAREGGDRERAHDARLGAGAVRGTIMHAVACMSASQTHGVFVARRSSVDP